MLVICVLGLLWCLKTHTVSAVDYQYGLSLDPPFSHFVVKPDFKNIGTEFRVTNSKDPVYMQIHYDDQKEFLITVYDIDADVIRPIDPTHNTFLLLSKSSKRFRIEISNKNGKLEPRDYSIGLSAIFKLVQTPKNVQRPILLEPKIQKSIILGVTEDGDMSFDPKIALFQNVNGQFSVLNAPQNLILTMQNRGNHLFMTHGTITLIGPNRYEETYTIPPTYVFANSQKNLSIEGRGDNALIPLPLSKLHSGQYSASVDLTIPGTNMPHIYGQTAFWLVSPIYGIASIIFCFIIIIVIIFVGLRHT